MARKDILSILFTAVAGFFFGIYIFFAGWFGDHTSSNIPTQEEVWEFTIVADVYGGCRNTCPSFQIVQDGSFRYLYTPAAGQEQVIRDGAIPRALLRELNKVMTTASLEEQSEEITPSICNSFTDGIDVAYRITLEGEEYVLDTCGTAINTDSSLWLTLVKTWNYFETGKI